MPVMYVGLPSTRRAHTLFGLAVSLGVVFCYVLNLLWAYFILEIVPQTAADGPSLAGAAEAGQISTVPLIDVIESSFPRYSWVAVAIESFIALSVAVSFVTISTGFRTVIDGFLT